MITQTGIKSSIKDNRKRGKVSDFLSEHIEKNSMLRIVSAYFTIYAYDKLKDKLNNINELKFLFGEPRFARSVDPQKQETKIFKIEDEEVKLTNKLMQKGIAKDCANWIKNKAQIRSIKQSGLLHGKMYHITSLSSIENAIIGSSNFTVKGLGLSEKSNIELNLEINDRRDLEDLKHWFEDIWNDDSLTEDVKNDVLGYLEQLYQNNSPELVYFKTLFHIFEKYLEDNSELENFEAQTQFTESIIWNRLFEFQKVGVRAAINKMNKYNGCIIADSVGLGKTFEALAVIKYYEQRNHQRVLVLCPKKLKENWTRYSQNYNSNILEKDKFNYDVLCHTDLSREEGHSGNIDLSRLNWENYDLIVIDESHNFRNNAPGRHGKQSRYEKLFKAICSGRHSKVLLLSATPVNNTLKDLRNQLEFITAGNDSAFNIDLKIPSLRSLLKQAQQKFTEWSKLPNKDQNKLLDMLSASFFLILDELTIARSRKHIKKFFSSDMEIIGKFPERSKPISKYSDIDIDNEMDSYDKINEKIEEYELSIFKPSKHVKKEFEHIYKEKLTLQQFTQENREKFLIGMMKSNFLKRLESSVNSFKITLGNTIRKIDNLITKIEQFGEIVDVDFDIENYDEEDSELEDLKESFLVGKKFKYDLKHINREAWLTDLRRDRGKLNELYLKVDRITAERDAKLRDLKELIQNKINNPTKTKNNTPNKKVIVFTAFSDTAEYIYENIIHLIKDKLNTNIALVTGSYTKTTFGTNKYEDILVNFSPKSKERSKEAEKEIDVLIATDCISEGQNLQDCDYLINYDIHWNPVKLIQRFGRIDRIGSINDKIQMVNFWPTEDLNKYIKLRNRVEARMALVDISATNADNILSKEEIEDAINNDLKYREKQLRRLIETLLMKNWLI